MRAQTNLGDDPAEEGQAWPSWWSQGDLPGGGTGPPNGAELARLRAVAREYTMAFERRPVPEDYESLKAEAKFLAGLSKHAFVLMAHRLLAIRDRQLYRREGYHDFRSFVEAELPLSRSTAYNYIDIVVYFRVRPVADSASIEYSKLIPALPLLRSSVPGIPKDDIRAQFLALASSASRRQIADLCRRLREKYGLSGRAEHRGLEQVLRHLRVCLPLHADEADRVLLREMRELLDSALGSGHGARREPQTAPVAGAVDSASGPLSSLASPREATARSGSARRTRHAPKSRVDTGPQGGGKASDRGATEATWKT